VAEEALPEDAPQAATSAIEDDVFNITVFPDTDDLVELEESSEDPHLEHQGMLFCMFYSLMASFMLRCKTKRLNFTLFATINHV
jgi:hypothetical protein